VYMKPFSRRTFVAGAAVPLVSGIRPLAAQSGGKQTTHRSVVASAWPAARMAEVLTPREKYRPFPGIADRARWESLPADVRTALVQAGEKQLKSPWEVEPATLFLEYARNGNRSRFEAVQAHRRRKVQELLMAECVEGRGRFTDELANGVWMFCEESFWGLPAHLGAQKAGVGLPDVTEPIVELYAGETANLLSWTAYLAGPQLAKVSPLIPERIRLEIDRRILTPCATRDDFGWMGYTGKPLNNWTPWICSNWLTATLLQDFDEKRRRTAVSRIARSLDLFLDGYSEDGGCDEGPSYWGRAGASLFDCLDLLGSATAAGAETAFRQPLVREIGRYICHSHISNEWYTNFADAPARVYPNGDLVYRYGKRVGDAAMMAHGAWVAFSADSTGAAAVVGAENPGRQLPALFGLSEFRSARQAQALSRDVWLPGIQVMAARVRDNSAEGLYLAAQGGHNAESHNHNDVGNFLVYANGKPAIIDVGVETYTAKTFSAHRYEIWTMQSAYHNCPTITTQSGETVMQSAGRQFAAGEVVYKGDDNAAELQLNIGNAYPKQAGIDKWRRTLRLDRSANTVELVDDFALRQPAQEIALTLMTCCPVTVEAPGRLSLAVAAGTSVKVHFDGQVFRPAVEEIRIEDARLKGTWGTRLFRIQLKAAGPAAKARWTTRFEQAG